MTKTMRQLIAESRKQMKDEIVKEISRDTIVTAVKNEKTGLTSAEQTAENEFFKALASRDQVALQKSNDYQVKQYEAKGWNWQTDEEAKTKAQTVGTVGSGTSGGILVPTTLRETILQKLYYISPMRQISTVINDMPPSLDMPYDGNLPTAYWVGEGATITESNATFAKKNLQPQKLAGLDSFTSEVLADAAVSPEIQEVIKDRFTTAIALAENLAFVSGAGYGSTQPYGFRSSDITPTTLATNTTAGNLAYGDIVQQFFTLPAAYRSQAVWVTTSNGVQLLDGIKDTSGRPIFLPGYTGVQNESLVPDTLFKNKLYVVEEIPTNLGTGTNETQLWFAVFKDYFIGTRGGLRMETGTNGTDFANDKLSWRIIERVVGRPFLDTAWTVKNIK